MKSFVLTMMGTAPMLVHNAQLSDPLNKWAREMQERMERLEKKLAKES